LALFRYAAFRRRQAAASPSDIFCAPQIVERLFIAVFRASASAPLSVEDCRHADEARHFRRLAFAAAAAAAERRRLYFADAAAAADRP